jgi:type IV pilus assembly protein PilA
MKKNGFTLVELLAVLVILALIMGIAVPSILSISSKMNVNMFCKRTAEIEDAAKLYGDDNVNEVAATGATGLNVSVAALLKQGYLGKDSDTCIVGSNCVVDPRNKTALDNNYVKVYRENNRTYAKYQYAAADATVCG